MSPHTPLHMFEHLYPRVEVQAVSKMMEDQKNLVYQIENTVKEIRSRVNYLTDKTNILGKRIINSRGEDIWSLQKSLGIK